MHDRLETRAALGARFCENLAGTTGLEPATSAVTGRHSNQLNYVPKAHSSVADAMVGSEGLEPPTSCL